MAYNLKEDYKNQLKELSDKEYDLNHHSVARNHVLVELFYFSPREEKEGLQLYIPDQSKILTNDFSAADATKKGGSAMIQHAGARAIVRVISMGTYREGIQEYVEIENAFKSGLNMFRVPAHEVEGGTINPEFMVYMRNTLEENNSTGKKKVQVPVPDRIPSWQKEWKPFVFTDVMSPEKSDDLLFEIPISKLKAPVKV